MVVAPTSLGSATLNVRVVVGMFLVSLEELGSFFLAQTQQVLVFAPGVMVGVEYIFLLASVFQEW